MSDTAWMKQGACIDKPTAWFFPEDKMNMNAARAVCAACPVNDKCLDYALKEFNSTEDHGCWGGTSPKQRRRIRRATAGEWNAVSLRLVAS